MQRANITWTAKALYNQIKKGRVNFDNYVQRNLVWKNDRKSLLIHSMLNDYPVPPFYATKQGDGYDFLDGKQRSNAIVEFMDDKFKLCDLENYDDCIDGFLFSELTEEQQNAIKDYSLTIYYFDGITDDEIEEMFFRLNNGKALTAIELTRIKAKSFDKIKELATHKIFDVVLTETGKRNYNNEDIIIKSFITLFDEQPSYETKYVRSRMAEIEITEQQGKTITKCLDKIFEVHNNILVEHPKVAKKIRTKTHLLSLLPSAMEMTVKDLQEFVLTFFAWGGRNVSIHPVYNECARYGTAKTETIQKRLEAMREKWVMAGVEKVQEEDLTEEWLEDVAKAVDNEVA